MGSLPRMRCSIQIPNVLFTPRSQCEDQQKSIDRGEERSWTAIESQDRHAQFRIDISFPPLAGESLEIRFGNKPRIVAKAGTTGCGPASDRVFDWQPIYRWGSAVWYPARQRSALAARFLQ